MHTVKLDPALQIEKNGHTSKGDQPKWQIGEIWYKADHMGYESLAEIAASRMLSKSCISDYVSYDPVMIAFEHTEKPGCSSKNFRNKNETLIPLERLHRAYHGISLSKTISVIPSAEERIKYTVEFVSSVTGLDSFGRYLGTLLEFDAFLLNEDRHTNNIAVIRNETDKSFRLCPFFDHGLSLLSDVNDYPAGGDIFKYIDSVEAKPFSRSFSEQADAAVSLYGSDLHFNISGSDITEAFAGLDELYEEEILYRADSVLREQIRKFSYLFK